MEGKRKNKAPWCSQSAAALCFLCCCKIGRSSYLKFLFAGKITFLNDWRKQTTYVTVMSDKGVWCGPTHRTVFLQVISLLVLLSTLPAKLSPQNAVLSEFSREKVKPLHGIYPSAHLCWDPRVSFLLASPPGRGSCQFVCGSASFTSLCFSYCHGGIAWTSL